MLTLLYIYIYMCVYLCIPFHRHNFAFSFHFISFLIFFFICCFISSFFFFPQYLIESHRKYMLNMYTMFYKGIISNCLCYNIYRKVNRQRTTNFLLFNFKHLNTSSKNCFVSFFFFF